MDSLLIPSQNILYTAINNLKYLHIMQTTIKIPFGYNTFSIGSHSIHTLKIRVKSSCNDLHTKYGIHNHTKKYIDYDLLIETC